MRSRLTLTAIETPETKVHQCAECRRSEFLVDLSECWVCDELVCTSCMDSHEEDHFPC